TRAVDDVIHAINRPGVSVRTDRVDSVTIAVSKLSECLEIQLVEDQNSTVLNVLFAAVTEDEVIEGAFGYGVDFEVGRWINRTCGFVSRIVIGIENPGQHVRPARTDKDLARKPSAKMNTDGFGNLCVIVGVRELRDPFIDLAIGSDLGLVDCHQAKLHVGFMVIGVVGNLFPFPVSLNVTVFERLSTQTVEKPHSVNKAGHDVERRADLIRIPGRGEDTLGGEL